MSVFVKICTFFISAMFVPLCAMDDYSESEEESSESSCQEILVNEDDSKIRTLGINYYHIFNEDEKIARSGKYFEPSEFWKKDIKEQMLFLKDEIKACDLIKLISSHYIPSSIEFFVRPDGAPYPKAIEEQFEDLVYERIKSFDPALSKEDFKISLHKNADPKGRFKKTPLLFHFDDYLCPYYGKSIYKKFSSKFEEWLMEVEES